jgi:hypothetical protein
MWTRRVFLATTAAALCAADDTPASADSILDAAKAEARDGRAIWVLFHASW